MAFAAVWTLTLGCVHQQPTTAGEPVTIARSFCLDSQLLGETRRYNVMLPPGHADPATRYPILLLLDGGIDEDFHHLSGLVQVSVGNGTMRPMLVVGIENTERRRDLTGPTQVASDRDIAPRVGGSARFRRFLAEELLPAIRRDYRTTAETAIAGESLAGLFVVETLLLQPDLFDDYIAVSPSIWWNHYALLDAAPGLLVDDARRGKHVFLSVGDEGETVPRLSAFAQELEAWTEVHYEPLPQETHATILHPAALRAFRTLLSPR